MTSQDVQDLAKAVAIDVARRRADGEFVPDGDVLAAHPQLEQALPEQLRRLRLLDDARAQTDSPTSVMRTPRVDPPMAPRQPKTIAAPDIRVTQVESDLIRDDDRLRETQLVSPAYDAAPASGLNESYRAPGPSAPARRLYPNKRPPAALAEDLPRQSFVI